MKGFNQSSSSNEYERLRKLQEGFNRNKLKKIAEKRFSEEEIRGMRNSSKKFENDLKRDGRAQPLRNSDTAFDRARKKISKINAVTDTISKVNWSEDGLYFVVFFISVVGDLGTAIIGLAEGVTGGLIALLFGLQLDLFVFGISFTIMMLYILNGHYKKRRAAMKAMVLLSFTFVELMPIVTALPGFIGSFVINYAMVLYERTVEDSLTRNKLKGKEIKIGFNQSKVNRRRIGARETIR